MPSDEKKRSALRPPSVSGSNSGPFDAKPQKPLPERELHEHPNELFSIPQHREHVIEPRDARAVTQVDRELNDRRHVCRGWRRDPATDANVCIEARDRMRLERLCRYAGRPAVATERPTELPDRRLLYRLKRPWRDGTSAVVFERQDFVVAKLAVLTPASCTPN